MQVKDVMTKDLKVIPRDSSIMNAAKMMKEMNVGALPVGDDRKVEGMITDRDITVQIVAEGKSPERCKVEEIMSSPVEWISADANVDEASQLMADRKVRRLIVMDHSQKPVGFLALGDVATKGEEAKAQDALQQISNPSQPAH